MSIWDLYRAEPVQMALFDVGKVLIGGTVGAFTNHLLTKNRASTDRVRTLAERYGDTHAVLRLAQNYVIAETFADLPPLNISGLHHDLQHHVGRLLNDYRDAAKLNAALAQAKANLLSPEQISSRRRRAASEAQGNAGTHQRSVAALNRDVQTREAAAEGARVALEGPKKELARRLGFTLAIVERLRAGELQPESVAAELKREGAAFQ